MDKIKEVSRLIINEKDILEIDYRDCDENRMIEILSHVRILVREENKKKRVLAVFNEKCFLTPKVMDHFKSERSELIERKAAIGITAIKRSIIDGHNTLEGNDIRVFKSKQEALDFLAGD